ncbi:hypothetical protein NPX13_g8110 [Xylaria arbuscula]|uniref:Uncharacterized protein n=1 Tax=Xylaria arbuscula TaxID=114810 RepID=A0A9W8TIN2_9PEZI|nr:hypothetical protein NPX13_g8110 [Xylaria arbuscula]
MNSQATEFRVTSGGTTHYITSNDVEEASVLEQQGIQRLYAISQSCPTLFYVSLPLPNGHIASTEIRVVPDLQVRARNPPFRVEVRYVLCHIPKDETTAEQIQCLCLLVQSIYDTYIVATRWKFTEECCKHESLHLNPDLCCRQNTQSGFDWLIGNQQDDGKSNRTQSAASSNGMALQLPNTPTALDRTTDISVVHPQQKPSTRRKRLRVDEGGLGVIEGRINQSEDTEVDKIAHRLAQKVKSGLVKFLKLKHQSLDSQARIRDLTSRCLVLKQDKKKLFEYVGQLEMELANKSSMSRGELNIVAWADWLFSCCLCQILSAMGDQSRLRRASAANLILGIVDKLLPAEGIDALGVIVGLSGEGLYYYYKRTTLIEAVHYHTLKDATMKGTADQDRISTLVAYKLRGQLPVLPDECEIPYPARWVSMITQVRYIALLLKRHMLGVTIECSIQDVHTSLGMSNLAFLGLPLNSTTAGAENTDTTSISMRQARQIWSTFEYDVNSEAGRVPRSLDLFMGPDFEHMRRAAKMYENDTTNFTHSIRQVLVALESPWMLATVAKEFSRLVHAWVEQRLRVEENMARATLHDLSPDAGAIEHEQYSELSASPTVMAMSSSATRTSLGPSGLMPEHDLGSSPLSMLLEAAHHATTPAFEMPQSTLPFADTSTQVQSPDGAEVRDEAILPEEWEKWVDFGVCSVRHIVPPSSSYGGGLQAGLMPHGGAI